MAKERVGRSTFDWMAVLDGLPLGLFLAPQLLIFLSLQLAQTLVVIVDGDAQHLFCMVLADDELVEVVLEHARGDATDAGARGIAERPARRLVGVVEAFVALAAEVGAVVLRSPRAVYRECAAADGGQDEVWRVCGRGGRSDESSRGHDDGQGGRRTLTFQWQGVSQAAEG